jgi:drug/metabolite transporter (DMT)-like permease
VLSLWFSIYLLGKRARWTVAPGILLAFAGMWLASTNGEVLNVAEVLRPENLGVYLLALAAAVTWGLYSNLSRKWTAGQEGGAVPLFLTISGVVFGLARLFVREPWAPGGALNWELAYMIVFPTMLAYIFWEAAMRKGRIITVVTLSYFIPLLSTLISSLRLGVALRPEIWAAALLIIAGAFVCRLSMQG